MNKSINAIVQITIPPKGWEKEDAILYHSDEVTNLSIELSKMYAKRVGADYYLITKPKINFKHPTWERFQLFDDEWINKYQNILYLDTDVFPWPDAPNIFDFINVKAFNTAIHYSGKTFNGKPAFNAGVFVLNKHCARVMRSFFKKDLWEKKLLKDPDWEDSKELNDIAQNPDIIHHRLSPKWNIKNSPDAYFTHMWGFKKKDKPNSSAIIRAKKILGNLNKETIELHKFNINLKNKKIPFYYKKLERNNSYYFAQIINGEVYKKINLKNKANLIIDLGANFGAASVCFALRYPDAIILSFEPVSESYKILTLNTESFSQISCYKLAASDKTDKEKIFIDDNKLGRSSLVKDHLNYSFSQSEIVETINFNEFIKENNIEKIDIIKIDVEGSEYKILKSIKKFLINIEVIYIEIHGKKNMEQVRKILSQTHFESGPLKETDSLVETIFVNKN